MKAIEKLRHVRGDRYVIHIYINNKRIRREAECGYVEIVLLHNLCLISLKLS